MTVVGTIFGRLMALVASAVVGSFAFVLLALIANPSMEVFGAIPFVVAVILVFGLPGFLLLRFALYAFHLSKVGWFGAAGMLNGMAFGIFISSSAHSGQADTIFFLAIASVVGAVTGAAYFVLEKGLSNGSEGGK